MATEIHLSMQPSCIEVMIVTSVTKEGVTIQTSCLKVSVPEETAPEEVVPKKWEPEPGIQGFGKGILI